MRGKKTHVYRVAGMIASIRGKKPHVYRVIILKQMADHSLVSSLMFIKSNVMSRQEMLTNSLFTLVLDNQTLSKPHMYYYHYLSFGWLDTITSTADTYYVQQRLNVAKL